MRTSAFYLAAVFILAGCLKTRADLRGETDDFAMQKQTVTQQRAAAAASAPVPVKPAPVTTASRFEEYDEQMRQLNGRMDVVENSVGQVEATRQQDAAALTKEKQALEVRLQAYEDALKKMEGELAALSAEVAQLKAPPPPPPPAPGRNAFEDGEEHFTAKNYKKAIFAYKQYRDANPKGKLYPEATYKIGLSFAELGMKDESKAFFEEVIAKFPGSKEAKKAALRLKSRK